MYTAFDWSGVSETASVLALVLHGTVAEGDGLGPSLTHGGRNVVL